MLFGMRRLAFRSVAPGAYRAQQTIRASAGSGAPARPAMLRATRPHHSFYLISASKDFL